MHVACGMLKNLKKIHVFSLRLNEISRDGELRDMGLGLWEGEGREGKGNVQNVSSVISAWVRAKRHST